IRYSIFIYKTPSYYSILTHHLNRIIYFPKENTEAKSSKSKMKKIVEVSDTEEAVAISMAKYTAHLSHKFAKERGYFTVVLSGGYLINSLRKLVEPPYINSVDWAKWHVFWLDERVVPLDHPDSNYKLAYDGFLSKVPIPSENIYPIDGTLAAKGAAEEAADDYEKRLKDLVNKKVIDLSSSGFPRFDLQLLGMGPDGHVASLFPGHPLLQEKQRWVTFIRNSPKLPPVRITFTFPVINSSAYVTMTVVGPGEVDAVATALGENQTYPLLPVQMVAPEVELKWFLDKEATSKLP
ncbi:probable 6-phosphogluconolactonase 4, partial [Mercurialis annua]|uniref:probable 6-phosphogluconolactonase 4 n=1 Tax=Mercurialis annua TaxID=3986 RepID=UPI002160F23F